MIDILRPKTEDEIQEDLNSLPPVKKYSAMVQRKLRVYYYESGEEFELTKEHVKNKVTEVAHELNDFGFRIKIEENDSPMMAQILVYVQPPLGLSYFKGMPGGTAMSIQITYR